MTAQPTIQIPRGIVDGQTDRAYVVGQDGRIFCLSLDTGEVLASTEFASIPVAVDMGMLIGWSYAPHRPNEIRLFSAARQERVLLPRWEQTLQLPEWVEVSSPEPDSFKLEAEFREAGVTITWEAHARYRGGAPPPVEVEKAALRDERRILEFDRQTGAGTGKARVDPAPRPQRITPALKPNTQIVAYRSGGSWDTLPWRADAVTACLIKTAHEPGIVLLHRDDRGVETEIRLTGNPKAAAAVTLDGSLIFIHEPGEIERAWHVFSTESGTRVASLEYESGTEGVSVVKDHVLYVVRKEAKAMRRRTLRCRNLRTGKPMWSLVLDEEAVRAPPPPPR